MENYKPSTFAEITDEMVEAWKKKHPRGIFKLVANGEKPGEEKRGYVRKPERKELKYGISKAVKGDPLGMAEVILDTVFLGGDQELLDTESDYNYTALEQLQELIEARKGELVKQ